MCVCVHVCVAKCCVFLKIFLYRSAWLLVMWMAVGGMDLLKCLAVGLDSSLFTQPPPPPPPPLQIRVGVGAVGGETDRGGGGGVHVLVFPFHLYPLL